VSSSHVAVIDIGSNSIRLVVYDRLCCAPIPRFNEKSLCALGRGIDETGRLDPGSADCALHILTRFTRLADAMQTAQIRIAATEAVRRASDGAGFLAEAERRIGRKIAVLSGRDEARFAALAVAHGFWRADGIVADLGGGSVELADVDGAGLRGRDASLPLGTLRLQPHVLKDRNAAVARIDAALGAVAWLPGAARGRSFYAVGGSFRGLARIHLAMTQAPLTVVHGYAIPSDVALKLISRMLELDRRGLAALPGIPRRRVETLPSAALLLQRLLTRLEPERVVFSALGLREGLLFDELGPEELAKDPLIEGAEDFGRARNRAAATGSAMAAWTSRLFTGESQSERRLRLAACAVSDVGWLETRDSRARDAFFMLAHYPFLGADHADRVFIAATIFIRYDGDPTDKPVRQLRPLMSESGWKRAEVLGRALQVGYRLSGGAPGLLEGTSLDVRGNELRLAIPDESLVPEFADLKSSLKVLAQALGVKGYRVDTAVRA
jgi:exopolyphosphatase/guanosine-5'-triphosphate,3'-diphosphate pyrophosphatase